jgi:uncharacterized peroxidase-related enzyme
MASAGEHVEEVVMNALLQEERIRRAAERPLVGHLPDYPGILAAMMISPKFAVPLRALADSLLVEPFKGSTLVRAERELIATAVSAGNDCFYCMDTHGAFASALLQDQGTPTGVADALTESLKNGRDDQLSEKLRRLIQIALAVREHGRKLNSADVQNAVAAGATDQDVQLAILIAAAFCMYNRMVDGLRARTPADPGMHRARARQIVQFGYNDSRVTAIPAVA